MIYETRLISEEMRIVKEIEDKWRYRREEIIAELVGGEEGTSNFSDRIKRMEIINSEFLCRLCRRHLRKGPYRFIHKNKDRGDKCVENCRVVCSYCYRDVVNKRASL